MNRPSHTPDDAFADWLDSGRNTSSPVGPATGNDADLLAACDAALLIDALNQGLERQAIVTAPRRTPFASILDAASPSPTSGMPNRSSFTMEGPVMDTSLSPPVAPVRSFRPPVRMAANRIVTLAAVVAILMATAGAAWIQRDRLGFGGGGDDPEPLSYGTFMLPNGQEVEVAYDVPAAEDCTVDPLTVDEMMEKLNAPYHTQESADAKATAYAMLESGTPLPESGQPHDYTLPEATYPEIAAVQREWLACSLFGSPFQRWALETHQLVQREFRQRYMPVIDLALIRQDLEDLAAGNENRLSAPTLTDESLLPMLPAADVDGMYNLSEMDGTAGITIVWVRPDGTALWNFGETMADLEPFMSASPLEQLLPNAWNFRLNPETGRWQLNDMRYAGG